MDLFSVLEVLGILFFVIHPKESTEQNAVIKNEASAVLTSSHRQSKSSEEILGFLISPAFFHKLFYAAPSATYMKPNYDYIYMKNKWKPFNEYNLIKPNYGNYGAFRPSQWYPTENSVGYPYFTTTPGNYTISTTQNNQPATNQPTTEEINTTASINIENVTKENFSETTIIVSSTTEKSERKILMQNFKLVQESKVPIKTFGSIVTTLPQRTKIKNYKQHFYNFKIDINGTSPRSVKIDPKSKRSG